MSLVSALSYAKSGLDRTDPKTVASSQPSDFDFLFALKLGKADFECARVQVAPFSASPNEMIKLSAQGTASVFASLTHLQDRAVAEYTASIDELAEGKLKPGTAAERRAELAILYDRQWKVLVTAVIAGTYAIVEADPATGRMSGLALTVMERDEILKDLRRPFGDEIKGGLKAGQIPLVSAAAALYQVVGDPQRKLREPR